MTCHLLVPSSDRVTALKASSEPVYPRQRRGLEELPGDFDFELYETICRCHSAKKLEC